MAVSHGNPIGIGLCRVPGYSGTRPKVRVTDPKNRTRVPENKVNQFHEKNNDSFMPFFLALTVEFALIYIYNICKIFIISTV